MKIQKIKLYKQKIVEKDGEFELEKTDEKEVPCVITNRALQMCNQAGVIKTSLAQDLAIASTGSYSGDGSAVAAMLKDEKVLQTIYVGYVGGQLLLGKTNPEFDFDEFIDRYNADTLDKIDLYQKLMVTEDNKFVQEINHSTKKTAGKGEKK